MAFPGDGQCRAERSAVGALLQTRPTAHEAGRFAQVLTSDPSQRCVASSGSTTAEYVARLTCTLTRAPPRVVSAPPDEHPLRKAAPTGQVRHRGRHR